MGTIKKTTTRSFTDENQAKTYFRGNILSKLEKLEYEDVDIPADSTEFNLYYACDDVEDDWFEMKIIYTNLD